MNTQNSFLVDIKSSSETVKGVAIIAVLINHYVNHYVTIDTGGFANTIVSIFFLLSGYGISISLKKRLINHFSLKRLFAFYRDRILKIFPLFWISLLLQMLVSNNLYSFSSFMGLESDGHYWFISAILQCYLFSPIFILMLSISRRIAFAIMTTIVGILYLTEQYYQNLSSILDFFHLIESPYLGIYFLHTYIFFIGMYVHSFNFLEKRTKIEAKFDNKVHQIIAIISLLLIILYMILDKEYFNLSLLLNLILIVNLTIYYIRNKLKSKVLAFIGSLSFPIYLFHMSYYFLLENIGFLKKNSLTSSLIAIAFFPVFIYFSLLMNNLGNQITVHLKEKMS